MNIKKYLGRPDDHLRPGAGVGLGVKSVESAAFSVPPVCVISRPRQAGKFSESVDDATRQVSPVIGACFCSRSDRRAVFGEYWVFRTCRIWLAAEADALLDLIQRTKQPPEYPPLMKTFLKV
ncbi:uncharacterized protein LOC123307603 [Coccinella septempunctata]|uniref:uncharacterized protein LOC123307603 n=1 Tax=Coccinella septempunctata TaxID=41139 RepID=UPI001D09152D|nr:uncharacterized protein LOC123307603 [Coccinella septempunctata]